MDDRSGCVRAVWETSTEEVTVHIGTKRGQCYGWPWCQIDKLFGCRVKWICERHDDKVSRRSA
jgi:hypothetical protein